MPEYQSKTKWDAENTKLFAVRLMRKTDEDVIDYLEPRNKRNTILSAVREYMKNHPEEN